MNRQAVGIVAPFAAIAPNDATDTAQFARGLYVGASSRGPRPRASSRGGDVPPGVSMVVGSQVVGAAGGGGGLPLILGATRWTT